MEGKMSVETQNQKNDPFGSRKVTQAEVAMFVSQAVRPFVQQMQAVNNAVDVLLQYLDQIGVGGNRITKEELIAFAQSKNNGAAKGNGTAA